MANHVTYTFADGREKKLKLTAERTVELEEKLGDSIQKKLTELDKLSIATEFIAAGAPDEEYTDRKKTAYAIYDDMTDSGKTLKEYLELVFNLLVSAGFVAAAAVTRQAELIAAQEKLEEVTHAAQMRLISQKTTEITGLNTEATQS